MRTRPSRTASMREPSDWDRAGVTASDDESTSVAASAMPCVEAFIGR
ncbi:hypothetical protein [Gemmatimonas sp.]